MKTFDLNGSLRTEFGKKASKKIRKGESIPCNLYGGKDNVTFTVTKPDVRKLVYTPHVYIVDLAIEGKKISSIMKEIAFHPVTDEILHIDFIEVLEDKPIVISIPYHLTGSAIGVRKGGKLKVYRKLLKVKGLAKYLPDNITVDITDLDLGKAVKVEDIQINENLSFVEDLSLQTVKVAYARTVIEDTSSAAPAAKADAPAAAAKAPAAKADAKAPAAKAPAAKAAAPKKK